MDFSRPKRSLGVNGRSYYSDRQRKNDKPDDAYHREQLATMRGIAKASDNIYGRRRIKPALNALSYPASRSKARKAISVQIKDRKKHKVTTDSNHKKPLFENVLDRQFNMSGPEQAYVGDITYLWTQEGWCIWRL